MSSRITSWRTHLSRASIAFILFGCAVTEVLAAAIIVDNFSGTRQFGAGARSFVGNQGGGVGSPPTFGEANGWGTITLTPGNSIVNGKLTYTAAAPVDLTGGGTNQQFLMEYVGVTTDNPTGFTQVANLQITLHTTAGDLQKSGIGVGEGIANQAIPLTGPTGFTGTGNLTQVTSIDIQFFSASNTHDGSIILDRVWVSPLAGAVPSAPSAAIVNGTSSPTASTSIHFTVNFTNNQGAAPVTGLTSGDFTLSGTAGATTVAVNGAFGSSYDIVVTGMTVDGTVGLSLGANTVTDLWQQNNAAGATGGPIEYVKPPVFTNGPAPSTVVYGTPYGPFTYTASGKAPITFALAPGSTLPAPLSLSAGGTLSGTPTALGTFTGSARATNVAFTDQTYSITVTCPAITLAPVTLPNPTQNAAYSQAITASGVPGTYTYAVTGGTLPAGMSLSAAGTLTGPATATGPASFTVTATGPTGFACSGSRGYSITVQSNATLDIDASNTMTKYDALTDGLLMIRYLFGLTGPTLTVNAIGLTATRTDHAAIITHLNTNRAVFDIDGDGNVFALTDGLLMIRYLFGLRGQNLIQGAFAGGAPRNTAELIESYLGTLTPP